MSEFPSVKHIPLSQARVNSVVKEIIEGIDKDLLLPKILPRTSNPALFTERDFITIGYNSIIDRIWFVDYGSGSNFYDFRGIGTDFAEGIIEGETNYLSQFVINTSKNVSTFSDMIKPIDIVDSLRRLNPVESNAVTILTNIRDHVKLWHYPELQLKGKLTVPRTLSHLDDDIEINFLRSLPEGVSIIIDSEHFGNVNIKKNIRDTVGISDIDNSEYDKILQDIPELKGKDLAEKVRVRAFETIKIDVSNPDAAVILKDMKNKEEN
jgi:hypothetical protein